MKSRLGLTTHSSERNKKLTNVQHSSAIHRPIHPPTHILQSTWILHQQTTLLLHIRLASSRSSATCNCWNGNKILFYCVQITKLNIGLFLPTSLSPFHVEMTKASNSVVWRCTTYFCPSRSSLCHMSRQSHYYRQKAHTYSDKNSNFADNAFIKPYREDFGRNMVIYGTWQDPNLAQTAAASKPTASQQSTLRA